MNETELKATLKRMLESRFKFYCSTGGRLSREDHHKVADAFVEDLMANEWPVLKEHLEYDKAQGFYGSKEMWDMIQRAKERIDKKGLDVMNLFPLPGAITHALLDAQ